MRNVVLLVKNGIGFGHIRRAILVAQELQRAGQVRPIIISQASSLALYTNSGVPVVNLPLLHRVPSAVAEDWYTAVLDRLLHRLDPAVVIEDTYPDARYQQVPSLAVRRRLLILRRLDGSSFDHLRQRGRFAHYDQILIAQDKDAFAREGHSPATLTAAADSGRFTFTGNIAYQPSSDEIAAARADYADTGTKLVVVNGGAGGDQLHDGYGDRLFSACHAVARRLEHEDPAVKFAFVTGPYYAGRPLADTPTILIRRFEPRLAALLAAADVAVIKPGNNALSEALHGKAQLVLVPDASFMEGLDAHAYRTIDHHGGSVVPPTQADLEPAIRRALDASPRIPQPAAEEPLRKVVAAIHRQARAAAFAQVTAKRLTLVLRSCAPSRVPPTLHRAVINPPDLSTVTNPAPAAAYGDQAPTTDPQTMADRSLKLIITRAGDTDIRRWLTVRPPSPLLLTAPAHTLVAEPNAPHRLCCQITSCLESTHATVIAIDMRAVSNPADYLTTLGDWLTQQPVELTGIPELLQHLATRLLQEPE